MNHKASATCPNGHAVELGPCQMEVKKFFGGTKVCGSKAYDELSSSEIQCMGCKMIYDFKTCPQCGAKIPISQFERKGIFAKLG